VVNLLGAGDFGLVYHSKYRGTEVAVKTLQDDQISKDLHEDLKRESQLMEELRNPYVAQYYGYSTQKGKACIVMELAELGNLFNILKDLENYPHFPWSTRLSIALDIAEGLKYLHK